MYFLNRTACLGGEICNLKFGDNHNFNNQQQVRVDMFMDIMDGLEQKPNLNEIINNLCEGSDRQGIHAQSVELRWLNVKKPDLLFMDNYSELVDKKITHKDGWSFSGQYSEFKKQSFEDGTLTDNGLLQADEIYNQYDRFFTFIKAKWNIPIIYTHFTTKFDDREKYKLQGEAIIKIMELISKKYNIQNIQADLDEQELRHDSIVYHFSQKTVKHMADKINITDLKC